MERNIQINQMIKTEKNENNYKRRGILCECFCCVRAYYACTQYNRVISTLYDPIKLHHHHQQQNVWRKIIAD